MTNDELKEDIKQEDPFETADLSKPAFTFIPKGRHTYRQEGPYLICRSCELHHAIWIGVNKQMVGEDKEGTPILKTLDLTATPLGQGGSSKLWGLGFPHNPLTGA